MPTFRTTKKRPKIIFLLNFKKKTNNRILDLYLLFYYIYYNHIKPVVLLYTAVANIFKYLQYFVGLILTFWSPVGKLST